MDIRKIKKLIELVEESGIAELEITEGEESVRIHRGPTGVQAPMNYSFAAPAAPQMAPAPAAAPASFAPGSTVLTVGPSNLASASLQDAKLKGAVSSGLGNSGVGTPTSSSGMRPEAAAPAPAPAPTRSTGPSEAREAARILADTLQAIQSRCGKPR